MGFDEVLLIGGIALILFMSRQLSKLGEAMRDVPEEERRSYLRYLAFLLCLGSLFVVAILFVLRHAIFRA